MADKPISDPLCRNIGNISSPSRFFFPTVIQGDFVHTIVESVFPHELIVINFEVIGDLVHFFVSGFRLCCVLIRDIQKEKARHRQTS